MRTKAIIEDKKEIKKTAIKTDSPEKKSIRKSPARIKSEMNSNDTSNRQNVQHSKKTASDKTVAAVIVPTRRKRIVKRFTEIRNELVLREHSGNVLNGFIILVGFFMIFEAMLGLQSNVILNIFTTNTTHSIIHLILGLLSVVVGMRETASGYSVFLGLLLGTVGVLRFIPSTAQFVIDTLNANEAVAILNISIAVVAFILSFTDSKSYDAVYQ